jgi:hypothetical protein
MTCLYLTHLTLPFGHAQHYLGFTQDDQPTHRLQHHAAGTGSNLLRHVGAAGIGWDLTRVWPGGDQTLERRIKARGGRVEACPLCRAFGPTRIRLPNGLWLSTSARPGPCRWCSQPQVFRRSWARGSVGLCWQHAAAWTAAAYGASPAAIAAGHKPPVALAGAA